MLTLLIHFFGFFAFTSCLSAINLLCGGCKRKEYSVCHRRIGPISMALASVNIKSPLDSTRWYCAKCSWAADPNGKSKPPSAFFVILDNYCWENYQDRQAAQTTSLVTSRDVLTWKYSLRRKREHSPRAPCTALFWKWLPGPKGVRAETYRLSWSTVYFLGGVFMGRLSSALFSHTCCCRVRTAPGNPGKSFKCLWHWSKNAQQKTALR